MSNREINYDALGVNPPRHEESEMVPIVANGKWIQRGNLLMKEGDELSFATPVPTNVILVGTDEQGKPILKRIDI